MLPFGVRRQRGVPRQSTFPTPPLHGLIGVPVVRGTLEKKIFLSPRSRSTRGPEGGGRSTKRVDPSQGRSRAGCEGERLGAALVLRGSSIKKSSKSSLSVYQVTVALPVARSSEGAC